MVGNKPKDYYKVLGVDYHATQKEIKNAFRILAKKYHPDLNLGNKTSEELFKDVREAYEILKDEKKRILLDIRLGVKPLSSEKAQTNQEKKTTKETPKQSTKADHAKNLKKKENISKNNDKSNAFSNLFENLIKNVDKSINSQTNKAKSQKTQPRFTTDAPPTQDSDKNQKDSTKVYKHSSSKKGEDISLDVYLLSSEALKGSVKTINILHKDPCHKCGGLGTIQNIQCKECSGRGEVSSHKKLDVKIPQGIRNSAKVKVPSEGNKLLADGERGDLYLNIKIYNPDNFQFNNLDVLSEVVLSPHEAILGCEVQVLTIDGFIKMKIPPYTQIGQKFRLTNQGLIGKNGERGNHFLTVKLELPKAISEREKELYNEISKISKFNPREYID